MENKKSNTRLIVLFAILVVVIFGGMLANGLIKRHKANLLKEHCTASTGGIVTTVTRTQMHNSTTSGWKNAYYIEVDFYVNDIKYTASATERRGENDYGQNARFKTNTTVTIMYNPENPNENYIKAAVMDTGKREMLSFVLVPAVFVYLAIDYKIKKRKESELE